MHPSRIVRPLLLLLRVGAAVALAFALACERSPDPTSPGRAIGPASVAQAIDLTYACGNKFLIASQHTLPLEVTWKVAGPGEEDATVLPPAPAADPGFSEIVVETTRRGTLELYLGGRLIRSRPNEARVCPTPPPA